QDWRVGLIDETQLLQPPAPSASRWSVTIMLYRPGTVPAGIAHDRPEQGQRHRADQQWGKHDPGLAGQVPQPAADGWNDDRARIADGEQPGGGARHVSRLNQERR